MPTASSLLIFALLALAFATACALHMQFVRRPNHHARTTYRLSVAIAAIAIGVAVIR